MNCEKYKTTRKLTSLRLQGTRRIVRTKKCHKKDDGRQEIKIGLRSVKKRRSIGGSKSKKNKSKKQNVANKKKLKRELLVDAHFKKKYLKNKMVIDLTKDNSIKKYRKNKNNVIVHQNPENIQIIELKNSTEIEEIHGIAYDDTIDTNFKDYLLRSRFVGKDPDMEYGGTSFNELMEIDTRDENFKIRLKDNSLLFVTSFQSLDEGKWVDDQIINKYFELLKNRDDELRMNDLTNSNLIRLESLYFDAYFLPTLLGLSISNVILDPKESSEYDEKYEINNDNIILLPLLKGMDKIYVPINLGGSHWILGVIYVQFNKVTMYDSLYNGEKEHKKNLLRLGNYLIQWIVDAVKVQETYNPNDEFLQENKWIKEVYNGNIQQYNGYDCGVYVMMTADFLSDNLLTEEMESNFSVERLAGDFFDDSDDLDPFRVKIGYDLLRGKLEYPVLNWEELDNQMD